MPEEELWAVIEMGSVQENHRAALEQGRLQLVNNPRNCYFIFDFNSFHSHYHDNSKDRYFDICCHPKNRHVQF